MERDFTSHGRDYALKFLSIIDKHRGKEKTSIKCLAESSESQKYRQIFFLPEGPQRKAEQIIWHFDQGLCSLLYKDAFFERKGDNFEQVPHPIDCGL